MNIYPKHFGKVINGKLEFYNKQPFLDAIKELDGHRVSLVLVDEEIPYSIPLNAYIHGVLFVEPTKDNKWGYTEEETKKYLKEKFAPRYELPDGKVLIKSFGKPQEGKEEQYCTNKEKSKFVQDCLDWFAEQEIYIAEPNQIWLG